MKCSVMTSSLLEADSIPGGATPFGVFMRRFMTNEPVCLPPDHRSTAAIYRVMFFGVEPGWSFPIISSVIERHYGD